MDVDEPLAGKSTLNRMELGTGINDRYKKITYWKDSIDELMVKVFIESHQSAPGEPDQRAVQPVRRPRERGDDASQSDAALPVGDGLHSGERAAAAGAQSDRTGAGAGLDDPHEVAQDRRPDPGHGS